MLHCCYKAEIGGDSAGELQRALPTLNDSSVHEKLQSFTEIEDLAESLCPQEPESYDT